LNEKSEGRQRGSKMRVRSYGRRSSWMRMPST